MLLKGREYYQRTKEQKRLSGKAYRLRHPERGRNNQLKRLYGITLDDYKTMLEKQDYNCKFCNEPLDNRPVVDHNHTTGLVRGVIHQKCNILIGFFETNGHLFSNLESYLKDHHETEQA
ncbi:MAG: endonuclease domain-containing protein [Candidatus Altimarinota bacterium]